jgi:hypothetical protein
MQFRIGTYVFWGVLLLALLGPATAECCKADVSTACCCTAEAQIEQLDCTPAICAGEVDKGPLGALLVPPLASYSISSEHVTDCAPIPQALPQPVISPTSVRERAPPLLFADLSLCFLPPPVQ